MEYHPLFIHFPIAFFFLELVLLTIWQVEKDVERYHFARFSFKLGYLFSVLAMMTGLYDADGISGITEGVRSHFLFALGLFLFCTVRAFIWRWDKPESKTYAVIQLVTAGLTNVLVIFTTFFGTRLG